MLARTRTGILRVTLVTTVLLSGLAGCGGTSGGTSANSEGAAHPTRSTLGLTSTAFIDGSSIPQRYTCDGQDIAPTLTWTRVPARARSLALLVEDRDAPGGDFVHWSLYNLPRTSTGTSGGLPGGSVEGQNSFGHVRYNGPCPPKGDPAHHYVFSLYALDDSPDLPAGASPASVRKAVAGHAVTTGTLTGLYRRR
jgi:Raf kinase inhibitor-like YbhB/YbcL family protein